jgi:hypothetical protein
MTDFDKLIKEKAEQATYSYDSAAWKSFQRKAGIRSGAWKYWVAGVSSIVAVGGIVVSTIIRKDIPQSAPEQESCVAVQDTALAVPSDELHVMKDTVAIKTTPAAPVVTPEHTHRVVNDHSNPEKLHPTFSRPVETPKEQHISTPRYGRPLVIDVDTIKENVPTDEELRNGNSRVFE